MSVKKTEETTSQKILNSDIYDITKFVDNIKKVNIDGITKDGDTKETLMIGMYGYLGYQFSSLLQNAIVTASELSNEAIPTRAKFDRNVITHALSLGVEKVAATAANMKVLLMFPEKALKANMIDGKFTLTADTPLKFDEFEFHPDYDITINYVNLNDSTNGSDRNYVYTATYNMDHKNPISDLENPFLPPISIFNYEEDNMVVLSTNLHQVYYKEINEKILDSDVIANKTINFSFDKQMSHFSVLVKEPSDSSTDSEGKTVYLNPVYDGLYNQEIAEQKYCYYQYINSNTIRIRFDPTNYQPPANSDIVIQLYTTDGSAGNFEYSEEKTIRLTSDRYTNLYVIVAQRGEDGSTGGLDRQTIEQLQHIIPKEALSRGSITTLTDLRNFFNSLNNENSVLHVFRKEDNILDRVYYIYNLMKDSQLNIVPTNTIPIYIESTRRDSYNGKIYLESGTPIYYYKFGNGANLPLLKNNFIGYLQQKVSNVETNYSFYDVDGYTTYQGTPTDESMAMWAKSPYRTSFEHELDIPDFEYKTKKPELSYDFHENSSVYFKPFYSKNIKNMQPSKEELYDNWFYGTCRNCNLRNVKMSLNTLLLTFFPMGSDYMDIHDLEIEWKEVNGSITTTTHFPKRDVAELSAAKVIVYENSTSGRVISDDPNSENGKYLTVRLVRTTNDDGSYKYTVSSIQVNSEYDDLITTVRFYRPRVFDTSGNVVDKENKCVIDIPFDLIVSGNNTTDINVNFYLWYTNISFVDSTTKFSEAPVTVLNPENINRNVWVPDYFTDIRSLSYDNKICYIETFYNNIISRYINGGSNTWLILDSINTIDVYSYDGQGKYNFDSMTLTEGDLIRFSTYNGSDINSSFYYKDPSTWTLGEVLSIEKNDDKIISIEVMANEQTETGDLAHYRYIIPSISDDQKNFDSTYIVLISKITKFLYTTPLSIVLKDNAEIDSHRITASYYLDIINETRYQEFDCINSKSPVQFILPSVKTCRTSYLSDNRYKYTISINLKPNTGSIDNNMINRTQVIAVFYKKGKNNTASKPIMYSIAQYVGSTTGDDDFANGIPYEVNLYSRPFTTSSKEDKDLDITDIIDDNNDVYIGVKEVLDEIANEIGGDDPLNTEEAKKLFYERYRCFYTDANNARPVDYDQMLKSGWLDNLRGSKFYASSAYLNLNTEMKIFVLYKYDIPTPKTYTDGLTSQYVAINNSKSESLYNSVPQNTEFTMTIPVEKEESGYIDNYTLRQMVLTNVYSTYQGINLLYDYSNIMNSYVTSIKTNDIFSPANDQIESYIINRVPCVRYFYWNTEERVNTFIKEMKKKINYVLDAISPLECTFGLDYKFFNTYGPSNMYHLTDDDGDATTELIDNVALTMTFRAKFYNEDSDAASIITNIKDSIKGYLEKLDQLDDIHFPNITTMIESEFAEYLIYFEFVSFNIYDAINQHIISTENMEMLSMVPEFLHVDTDDLDGTPYINIRVVTS